MAIDVVQNRKAISVANPNSLLTDGESYIGVTDLSTGDRKVILSTKDLSIPGFSIQIKDETGEAVVGGAIEVETQGSAKIDDSDVIPISEPYGSRIFYSNGTNWFQEIGQLSGADIEISTTATQLAPAVGSFQAISFSPVDVDSSSNRISWIAASNRFDMNYSFFYEFEIEVSVSRVMATSNESLQFAIFNSGTQFGLSRVIELTTDQSIIQRMFNFRKRIEAGTDVDFYMIPQAKAISSTLGLYPALKANPSLTDFVSASCKIYNVG